MDTHNKSQKQAILHVVHHPDATSRQMQDTLLQTGRTVLTREDLFQAMGALAASERSIPINSVVISAGAVSHQDAEFFEIVTGSFADIAIYVYGESTGAADRIIPAGAATHVTPQMMGSLFEEPDIPPFRSELPIGDLAPKNAIKSERQTTVAEPEIPSELEERLLRGLDESDAGEHESPAEAPSAYRFEQDEPRISDGDDGSDEITDDHDASETETETEDDHEQPPVPWNPSLARPSRTPPKDQPVLEVINESVNESDGGELDTENRLVNARDSEPDQPLLTREELDALLREGHDSTGGLEQRI